MTERRAAHRRALVLMVIAPLLWSTAGVVARWLSPELQQHGRFEIAFWRSVFAALAVGAYLAFVRRDFVASVRGADASTLLSGLMWCVMFSAFMLALSFTTVANTLIVLSVAPLLTALLARFVLARPIAMRTWIAIGAALGGMVWMFAGSVDFGGGGGAHALGMLIALAVPLASAINLVTLEKRGAHVDLIPAVFIGGVMSAAVMLPFIFPLHATAVDVALLGGLGLFQLGLPCVLLVVAARSLSATELSLLALLEVLLGPLWAWLGAGEIPAAATLYGGALVLAALVGNELHARSAGTSGAKVDKVAAPLA